MNHTGVLQESIESEAFLGKGADAAVWRSSNGRFVRKQYLDADRDLAAIRAQQEFSALQVANRSLASRQRVRCPEPCNVDNERGELLLEYYDGVHLNIALNEKRFADPAEIRRLAEEIGTAMVILTGVLSLNQLDFSVRNTLISPDRGEICFIDFATRISPRLDYSGARPIEVALASLLTSAITYQLHQSTLVRMTESKRLRNLAASVFDSVSARNALDVRRVRTLSWRFYWRQSVNRGWKRYIWFHTIGALAFKLLLNRVTRSTTPPPTPPPDKGTSQQRR